METTLNTLVYDLALLMRGGRENNEEAVSHRQIASWVKNTRAQLIRQDLNKGRSISDNITQTLSCVPVSQVDASACCGINTSCTTYRTTSKLPKFIETAQDDLMTYIGPIALGSRPFHIVPIERIPYIGYSPFSGINDGIKAAIQDRYAYLFVPDNDRVLSKITVRGVFADPTEAATFTNCSGVACYTDDSSYPISEHMVETLKQMILNTDIKMIATAYSDNKGDGDFSLESNITK